MSAYGLDEKCELYPLRTSKVKNEKHVMLLLIEEDAKNHYLIMLSLSPFIDKKQNWKKYS